MMSGWVDTILSSQGAPDSFNIERIESHGKSILNAQLVSTSYINGATA